jgi:hypothetical protein
MDFPLDEADDILLDQYTVDITDAEPDPIRARGSVHRGAAYLQEIGYPPHGASSGQEGGSMRPVEEIEVFGDEFDDAFNYTDDEVRAQHIEALEGDDDELASVVSDMVNDELVGELMHRRRALRAPLFHEVKPQPSIFVLGDSSNAYCHGLDVLGAGTQMMSKAKVAPRMGSVLRSVPNGNKYLSKQVGTVKVGDYKSTLRNARDIGQHAVDTGNRLLAVLKQRASAPKSTRVHGIVTSAKRPGKGKKLVRVTPVQAKKMAQNAKDYGAKALAAAKKFAGVLDSRATKQQSAQDAIRTKMARTKAMATMAAPSASSSPARGAATRSAAARGATKLRGEYLDNVSDFLGAYSDTLSEELAFELLGLGEEAPASETSDPNAPVTVDDSDLEFMNPDKQPTVAPPRPLEEYDADPNPTDPWNDEKEYTALPRGAILFNNQPGIDSMGEHSTIGSVNRFSMDSGVSMKNPAYGKDSHVPGGEDSGFQYSSDGWQHYKHSSSGSGYSPPTGSEMNAINRASVQEGYGPIIGRPGTPFKGLRFIDNVGAGYTVTPGKSLFWFYDTAPKHMKQQDEMDRLNQALTDWHTAKAAYDAEIAARALAAFLEAEEAKALLKKNAKEDAADTRKQDKEKTEAEHQAAVADTAAQQELKTTKEFETAATEEEEKRGKIEEERYARTSEQDVALTERLAEKEAALAEQREQADYDREQAAFERMMALAEQEGAAAPAEAAEDLENAPGSGLVETSMDDGNLSDYADLAPAGEEWQQGEDGESAESVLGGAIPNYIRGSDRLRAKRQDR